MNFNANAAARQRKFENCKEIMQVFNFGENFLSDYSRKIPLFGLINRTRTLANCL